MTLSLYQLNQFNFSDFYLGGGVSVFIPAELRWFYVDQFASETDNK